MKKLNIFSKTDNVSYGGYPPRRLPSFVSLLLSIVTMLITFYNALFTSAPAVVSYTGMAFSGVFMFVAISLLLTNMNMYKNIYYAYFSTHALILFMASLLAGSPFLAASSVIFMYLFCKGLEWVLEKLQFHLGIVKVRGNQ